MTQAQGAGKTIGGWSIPRPYMRCYAFIQPILNTPTGVMPGGIDTNGQYAHFLYEGNLNLGSRSNGPDNTNALDYVPNKIAVEFDAMSCFTLPFEGSLYVIGGLGEYRFGISPHDVTHPELYQPSYRTLRTKVVEGGTFVVPNFHSFIVGSDPNNKFTLPDGAGNLQPPLLLPGQQINTGLAIVAQQNCSVQTGWYG